MTVKEYDVFEWPDLPEGYRWFVRHDMRDTLMSVMILGSNGGALAEEKFTQGDAEKGKSIDMELPKLIKKCLVTFENKLASLKAYKDKRQRERENVESSRKRIEQLFPEQLTYPGTEDQTPSWEKPKEW